MDDLEQAAKDADGALRVAQRTYDGAVQAHAAISTTYQQATEAYQAVQQRVTEVGSALLQATTALSQARDRQQQAYRAHALAHMGEVLYRDDGADGLVRMTAEEITEHLVKVAERERQAEAAEAARVQAAAEAAAAEEARFKQRLAAALDEELLKRGIVKAGGLARDA